MFMYQFFTNKTTSISFYEVAEVSQGSCGDKFSNCYHQTQPCEKKHSWRKTAKCTGSWIMDESALMVDLQNLKRNMPHGKCESSHWEKTHNSHPGQIQRFLIPTSETPISEILSSLHSEDTSMNPEKLKISPFMFPQQRRIWAEIFDMVLSKAH